MEDSHTHCRASARHQVVHVATVLMQTPAHSQDIHATGRHKKYRRPWNVLLAWSGVDGLMLDVAKPASAEAIENILSDLGPVIDDLKHDRLSAGLTLEQACPIGHCTDSYGKHRLRLDAFYRGKYPDLAVRVRSTSAKSDASGATAVQEVSAPTLIAGDPAHDLFALRRRVSVTANDAKARGDTWFSGLILNIALKCLCVQDLTADHAHLLSALSLRPSPVGRTAVVTDLAAAAEHLLVSAVKDFLQFFVRKPFPRYLKSSHGSRFSGT